MRSLPHQLVLWLVLLLSQLSNEASSLSLPKILNPLTNRQIQLGGPTYRHLIEEGHWVQYNGTLHPLDLDLIQQNAEGLEEPADQNDWTPTATQDEWFAITPTTADSSVDAQKGIQQDLLFVHKPSGLHCVPPRDITQPSLANLVQSTFPEAKPCHRLDYDTSGIVLFGLTKESHAQISKQFEERTTSKTYLALVAGHPQEDSGVIDIPIGKRSTKEGHNRWATPTTKDAPPLLKPRDAVTHWSVLERRSHGYSLMQLTPQTGRGHQLRLHMKALGHPILGDTIHAPPAIAKCAPRLCLHAHQLQVDWGLVRLRAESVSPF